ncbi:MAG: DUF4286 family protein [Ferruginibacter sp.]
MNDETPIVYNITIKVSHVIADKWLQWLQTEHIADLIGTGCFTSAKVLRLLEVDNSEGPTYAVQYFAESKSLYNRYIENFAELMRKKAFEKWGDQFIGFQSVMIVVN